VIAAVAALPPLCLYHKNCLDGSAAAAVVARREPGCEFLAVQYGTPLPRIAARTVYVVDFGFPIEDMRALRAQASTVHWIDHHISQTAMQRTLGWGVLDPAECGSTLVWRELFPREPLPLVLEYVRDKDLWRWLLPDSRAICAGLAATYVGERFREVLTADLAAMAAKGRPLVAKLQERVAAATANGIRIENPFGRPGRALVVFSQRDTNELGDHICLPPERGGLGYDLALILWRKPDGAWVHSMRSGDIGLDCGTIAAERGGGGHRQSACFTSPVPVVPPPPAAIPAAIPPP
jgi:hypothetical protein